MEYTGRLYGKVRNTYFDTGKTSEDFDRLTEQVDKLKEKLSVDPWKFRHKETPELFDKDGYFKSETVLIETTDGEYMTAHVIQDKNGISTWGDIHGNQIHTPPYRWMYIEPHKKTHNCKFHKYACFTTECAQNNPGTNTCLDKAKCASCIGRLPF